MKIDTKPLTISFTDNFFFTFHCDWTQLGGKYNWYTFNLLRLTVENEPLTGSVEIELYLLGFGLRVRWNYNPQKLKEMVEEKVSSRKPKKL